MSEAKSSICAPFPGQGLPSASLPFSETKGAQIPSFSLVSAHHFPSKAFSQHPCPSQRPRVRRFLHFPWFLRTFFRARPSLSILPLLRDLGCADSFIFLGFCAPFSEQGPLSASLPFSETKGAQTQNEQHLASKNHGSFFETPQISGRLRLGGGRRAAAWAALEWLRKMLLQPACRYPGRQRLQAVPSHTCCGAGPTHQAPGSA